MPFPMTHLLTAHIIAKRGAIERPEQFMIGAMAPDAVHTRKRFSGEDKFLTHLCVGDKPWGSVEDNEAWRKSALAFLRAHESGEDRSFFQGYCVHVLTDIAWNEKFYQPLKRTHPEEFVGMWSSPFHASCNDVDIRLYEISDSSEIFALLRAASPVSVPGLLTCEEVGLERDGLLTKYDCARALGARVKSAVTLEAVCAFIREEGEAILLRIQEGVNDR